MTEGFSSPVLGGGGALIRPNAHSPNYVPGTSGWTINKDGSAEFSNLTLRGTFDGTDFVVNSAGIFVYSGTPAAQNLIASIAANAGTDAFGNGYIPGVVTYRLLPPFGQVSFIQLVDDNILIGSVNAGVFDIPGAASFTSENGNNASVFSGLSSDVTKTDEGALQVFCGIPFAVTGAANAPYVQALDDLSQSPVDQYISGSVLPIDNLGTRYAWQAPSYNTNWATSATFNGSSGNQGLHFRKSTQDDVRFEGMFKAGAVAPGAVLANLPAPYRPIGTNRWITAFRNNGGVITPFAIQWTTGGNLNIVTTFGGGIAINNEYYIPPQDIPLGNIT